MPTHSTTDDTDDIRTLHKFGYAQELARVLGGFSNFAISFAIIGILFGGVTSFQRRLLLAWAARAIGLGWPLVCLFSLMRGGDDGSDRLGVPDRGRALPLGGDPGRPGMGLGHGLVQPGRA